MSKPIVRDSLFRLFMIMMIGMIWIGSSFHAADADYVPAAPLSPFPVLHLQGTLMQVDPSRHQVVLVTADGSQYTLDTQQTDIALPGHSGGGSTADLARGMRVRIDGEQQKDGTILAVILRVVGLHGPAPAPSVPAASPILPAPAQTGTIHLRGTISSIDLRQNNFIVQINNQARVIVMNDNTQITSDDLQETVQAGNSVPFQAGDRATVVGELRADGTVLAASIHADPAQPTLQQIVGQVSQTSNRYWSRDIKVQIANGENITVHVPNGTLILRQGRPISVHDLTTQDEVRIDGIPDGNAIQATLIRVLNQNRASF